MRLRHWTDPLNTFVVLAAPLLLLATLLQFADWPIMDHIVTEAFLDLILVVGLQIFMGNTGILGFAHIGFMGIGAYTSAIFSMTPLAISSTAIRNLVRDDASVRYLTPDPVADYIRSHKLYMTGT